MKIHTLLFLLTFSAISVTAQSSEFEAALVLKQEALEIFRGVAAGNSDPAYYASGLRKLILADELLEKASTSNPEETDRLRSEIASARFWSQRFANMKVVKELRGGELPKGADKPAVAAVPPPEPAAATEAPDVGAAVDFNVKLKQLLAEGKSVEATALIQELLAKRKQKGETATMELYARLGELCSAQGQFQTAETFFKKSVEAAEKQFKPDDPMLAIEQMRLVDAYIDGGKHKLAEPLLKRILALQEKAYGPDHPEVAETCERMATVFWFRCDWTSGEKFYARSLAIRKKEFGPESIEVARSLIHLATTENLRARFDAAEDNATKALAILEKKLGPDHPRLFQPLRVCSDVARRRRKTADAIAFAKRGLEIVEKACGPEHPTTAIALNLMGVAHDGGNERLMRDYFERALAVREKVLWRGHWLIAQSLNNIASSLPASESKRAEELLNRATAILQQSYGAEHFLAGSVTGHLGGVRYKQERYKEAEVYFQQALAMHSKIFNGDHFDIAMHMDNIGLTLTFQGKAQLALPYHQRAIAMAERIFGLDSPRVATYLSHQAFALQKLNKTAEADAATARAKEIERKSR